MKCHEDVKGHDGCEGGKVAKACHDEGTSSAHSKVWIIDLSIPNGIMFFR